jgi:hypothetical protein
MVALSAYPNDYLTGLMSRGAAVLGDKLELATKETPSADVETVTPCSEGVQPADLRMLQMLVTAIKFAQEPTPITINNIHATKSEHTHTSGSTELAARAGRPMVEVFGEMFNTFFSSGFNRVCFFGMCGMGMYVYWSYLDHKWHMAEVQRRIDSNFLLRMTQWLFSDAPVQPRGQIGAVPQYGRVFSFW